MKKLLKKIKHFTKSMQNFYHAGTKKDVAHGAIRIALRHPSDFYRKLKWKKIRKNFHEENIKLNLEKFDILVMNNDDGIAAELAVDKMHEPYGTEILLSIIQDNMTVVDLGANIGYYVLQQATHKNLEKIIAIEPNPVSFECLKKNIDLNNLKNVDTYNIAISDTDGTCPFYISKISNICSITPKTDYEKIISVPVTKLDSFVKKYKIKNVDLVRMDIEGHEVHAIRGMLNTLKTKKPWICMEYHSPMIDDKQRNELIQMLDDVEYELKAYTFRWVDYPIFGKTIADTKSIIKHENLKTLLNISDRQTLLLFLAHKDKTFTPPKLIHR